MAGLSTQAGGESSSLCLRFRLTYGNEVRALTRRYLMQEYRRMPLEWYWFALAALILLAIYQQFRIYQIHCHSRGREEIFQIVAENAADMIALVDVKGHR